MKNILFKREEIYLYLRTLGLLILLSAVLFAAEQQPAPALTEYGLVQGVAEPGLIVYSGNKKIKTAITFLLLILSISGMGICYELVN